MLQEILFYLKLFLFDFYLIDYNYVIEVNGGQHYYENKDYFHSSRTLQEQQEVDQYKKQFCIDNNIGYLELPFWLLLIHGRS